MFFVAMLQKLRNRKGEMRKRHEALVELHKLTLQNEAQINEDDAEDWNEKECNGRHG